MKLVIAEKPMLARDIARAICGILVSETERLPLSGNGYTVCACAGHLFELQDPADIDPKWGKSWTVESLPITVEDWPKVAVSDKERLVSEIQGLLQDAEMVIHAGDPDDEGQLIVDELLEALGWQGKVMRVLVNDNIEKNVQRAFTELRPNDEFENAGRAAYARQMADAAFGFTETRLATKQLGALMSVGRVQTPTLGMVVTRDEQIAGHVKQTYYELCADVRIDNVDGLHTFKFKPGKELLQDEKHLYDASALEEAKECVEKSTHVIETAHSTKTEQPPLPYNLTVLIADMSELYKMPAALTQQVTQDLRDKYKAITYNRSDCQYLKEEHFVAAEVVLGCAMKNLGVAWSLDFTCRSKAFNEKNVTAHHAIIPQEVSLTLAGMTEHEQRVYKAIVERYAMQFLAPARYEVSTSIFKTDKGHFECVYTKETDAGWKATFEKKSDKEKEKTSESLIKAGESTGEVANTTIVQKETSPPKPYTRKC